MTHEELRERWGLYVLDALAPEERRELESHLAAGCPACQQELRALREALDLLPYASPLADPPPAVRARLLQRGRAEGRARATPRAERPELPVVPAWWRRWAPAAWGLALAGVALTLLLGWGLQNAWRQLALLEAERGRLEVLVARQQEAIEGLRSPEVRIVSLARFQDAPAAVGRIFWYTAPNVWEFKVYRLPPAPPGKTYQLWFITREAKISAGTFQTSETGDGALRVPVPPEAAQVTAAAVTLEPEGGVPQPTGPIYLYGGV
ncbi:MAG: anti-sigma factor [candidate division NC10 bacterium]|nr:anti-sigma factor [candidate division NC10 bacterium]